MDRLMPIWANDIQNEICCIFWEKDVRLFLLLEMISGCPAAGDYLVKTYKTRLRMKLMLIERREELCKETTHLMF